MIGVEATGAIIPRYQLVTVGTAEIDLDGELDRTAVPYPDEDEPKGWESFWHNHRLDDGRLGRKRNRSHSTDGVSITPPSRRGLWGTMARPGAMTVPSG